MFLKINVTHNLVFILFKGEQPPGHLHSIKRKEETKNHKKPVAQK